MNCVKKKKWAKSEKLRRPLCECLDPRNGHSCNLNHTEAAPDGIQCGRKRQNGHKPYGVRITPLSYIGVGVMKAVMTAQRRRHISRWLLTSNRPAGCTPPEGGKAIKLSAVTADTPEAVRADPNLSAHPSINPKPNTPAPMSAVAGGRGANGEPHAQNSHPNGLKAFQHLST